MNATSGPNGSLNWIRSFIHSTMCCNKFNGLKKMFQILAKHQNTQRLVSHMSRLQNLVSGSASQTFFHYCSFNEPNCVDICSRCSSLPPSPQEMLMLEIHYTSVYILWSLKAAKYTVSEISHFPKTNITPIRSNIARFRIPDLGQMFIYL